MNIRLFFRNLKRMFEDERVVVRSMDVPVGKGTVKITVECTEEVARELLDTGKKEYWRKFVTGGRG